MTLPSRSVRTRILVGTFLAICLLSVTPVLARADSVELGTLSFDPFIPGFIDAFTVTNSTSAFSLPPLFPVANAITFADATLVVQGTAPANIPLGNLAPGGFQSLVSDFSLFSSASFQAQLSTTSFTLANGSFFEANSNLVTATLTPSVGFNLLPGLDFAPITVSGSIATAPVPEPPTWWLLFAMIPLIILFRRDFLRL